MLSKNLTRWISRADLPPAVVVGSGLNGLTVARALGQHGVPVIAVDHRRRRYTSYSGAFHLMLVPSQAFCSEELPSFLRNLAGLLPRKAALILTMDEAVDQVGAHGQDLKETYYFRFPSPQTVTSLGDKGAFYQMAVENDWPVPKTFSCKSVDEVAQIASDLTYPVIVKPQTKNLVFRTSSPKKAFKCEDREELLSSFEMISQWVSEAIVQDFIPGGDDEVYFSFHFLSSDLKEVSNYQGKKIRQYKPECGSTASAIGVNDGRLAEASRELLAKAGCVGFGSVEYKRDPRTDKYYITEPTVGRPNLQVGLALTNGVDIISQGYFDKIGQTYPKQTERTYDRKWIILRSDLRSARYYIARSEYTWMEYFKFLRGPKTFAVWRLNDPKMAIGAARVWRQRIFRYIGNRTAKLFGSSTASRVSPPKDRPDSFIA